MYSRHAHIILVQTAAALILLLTFAASFRYTHAQSAAAHWSFNEGSGTSASDTAGGHTGVLQNGAAWVAGRSGNAVALDGIDDYVRVTDNDTLDVGTGNFTIAAWVRFDAFTAGKSQPIFIKQDANTVGYAFFLDVNRHLALQGKDASVRYAETGASTLSPNTWYFVVGVGDRANGYRLYINGVQESTTRTGALTDQDGTMSNAGDVTIGANLNSGNYARAAIDEVRLYSLALSSSEIPALYAAENSTPAASKPNIIVIMTDNQDDITSLSFMQNVQDLLIKEGTRFLNSFVSNSLCCPSRATFLTGQLSHNNGIYFIPPSTTFNGKTYTGGYTEVKKTEDNTLPMWLQSAGYTTGIFGKYLNGFGTQVPITSRAPGWDSWFVSQDAIQYFNYTVNDNGTIRTYGSAPSDYYTDVVRDKAVEFIHTNAPSNDPFFLFFTPVAPHVIIEFEESSVMVQPPVPAPRHQGMFANTPLPQSPSFNEADTSDKPYFMQDPSNPIMSASKIEEVAVHYRARLETLQAADEAVKAIIDELQAQGELENTVILFTSDNGMFMGEHRREEGYRLIYEESIRVPLIVRGPDVPVNQTRSQLVSNVDLPATVLDYAAVSAGRTLDGRSFRSAIENAATPWRSTLFFQAGDKLQKQPITDGTLYGMYQAVRTPDYVYAEHEVPGGAIERELYDLSTDPYELTSTHNDASYSLIMADLKSRLDALKACIGSACWIADSEPGTRPGSPPSNIPPTPNPDPNPNPIPPGPYNTFPPVQLPDGTWVQPMSGGAASTSSAGSCPLIMRNLSEGMQDTVSDKSVAELQHFLTATGDYTDYTYGSVTGYFGSFTTAAVKRFQCRTMQLCSGSPDSNGYGTVGPATRAKIAQVCAGGSSTMPTPPSPGPVFTRNLQVGDSGNDVSALQELLIREGVYPEAIVSGYFGELTRRAVARFQEKYASEILTPAGLTQGTGYFGALTRAKANQLW